MKKKLNPLEGLNQGFKSAAGKTILLKDFFKPGDFWTLKKDKSQAFVVTHNAVKKIADIAGIKTDPEYSILTQPDIRNNYQQTWQVKICDGKGRCTTEIGESNRDNLGSRGRKNPGNMAQKRAFDRAVLRHVGLNGFLGEEELPDEEENNKRMEKEPSHEEKQTIAPLINEIINAKNKAELTAFSKKMKTQKGLKPIQLEYLRLLWLNQNNRFVKTF